MEESKINEKKTNFVHFHVILMLMEKGVQLKNVAQGLQSIFNSYSFAMIILKEGRGGLFQTSIQKKMYNLDSPLISVMKVRYSEAKKMKGVWHHPITSCREGPKCHCHLLEAENCLFN